MTFDIENENNEEMINTSFLYNLINLEYLKLNIFCNFFGKAFIFRDEDFYILKNLKFLQIFYTKNDIPIPEFTGKCFQYFTKLEKLSCGIEYEIQYLKYLTNIKYLKIKYTKKELNYFKELSYLKKLEKLKFEGGVINRIKDLQLFINLKHLIICGTTINDNFDNLPNLKTLKLQHIQDITDKQIMNLENLTKLIIEDCPVINGEFFLKLIHLQHLEITSCYNVTYCQHISNLKKLIYLNVGSLRINDNDLMELNNIQHLDISTCLQLVSGIFLLNMNKLIQLNCFSQEVLHKIEIDKLKDEIKKGSTFKQAVNYVINNRKYKKRY